MRHVRATLFSIAAVAIVTGAVYLLEPVAPVLSLGALYVFAVLPVAVFWGLGYAISVAIASELVFNFLFLPPVHTLSLSDGQNWVALTVYLVIAVVVSELAARERRRTETLVAAERLRRSDAIKTAVLRSVSHDLRSPLTAIRAAGEGLESASLAPAEREALVDTVRTETDRLDRLVVDLLDLSRLEAGATEPHPELWTADSLAGRALEQLGADAARVAVLLPDDLPPVNVDAAQIDRVLVNLLENALKFTPEPSAVELSAGVDGSDVVMRVVDHGAGVEEDDRERVFEPFERGTASAGRPGSGLGLAIARGFAQANGCRVWAEAGANGGATFALALPAAAPLPGRR